MAGKVEGNKVVDEDNYQAGADGKVHANGVFGALFTGPTYFPQMYLANFEFEASASAEAAAKIKDEKDLLSGTGALNADVTASAGFVAHSAVDIQEVDVDGNVVNTWMLCGLCHAGIAPPSTGTMWTSGELVNGAEDTVHTSQHIGKYGDNTLKITMIASDKSGELSSGSLVTSQSVELTYDYTGPALKSAGNHLRLRMGVATAEASAQATASGIANGAVSADAIQRLKSGAEDSSVWVDFAKVAVVSDKEVNVKVEVRAFTAAAAAADTTVEGSAAVDLLGGIAGAAASGKASAAGSGSASVQLVTVDFPAGATSFFYDPTVGAGPTPDPQEASSAATMSMAFASVIALFVALF